MCAELIAVHSHSYNDECVASDGFVKSVSMQSIKWSIYNVYKERHNLYTGASEEMLEGG